MAIVAQPPAAIEIQSLSKIYYTRNKTAVKAVNDLNLSVPAGQIFGFLGSNGAGKTTTIKMACGLVTPTAGSVLINGHDVARERGVAMRQLGVVLEGTRNIYWRLTAWQNLIYFGHLKDQWGKPLAQHAEKLLRELDLWERRKDEIRTFSRGMQQKVAIACALITNPSIVLLDEPTLGLDVQASATMKEWILKLAREEGRTVVLTTHQLDLAEELCDRVAIMRKGNLLVDKPLNSLLHLFRQEHYEIRVKGILDETQAASFAELTMSSSDDETVLTGSINDQKALHTYIDLLQGMNLPLISVQRVEPNLEDVFVHLLTEGEKEENLEKHLLNYA